ncbi:MAG: peptide deformylase, partial [bacterium]|nr:peptide deformylase [bacterium]
FIDENGKPHKRKFSGFIATIIQHEYDHLHGILFPKRVLEQKGKLYKSRKNKEGKDVFEEIEI